MARVTREDWVAAATRLLCEAGVDRVTIGSLCEALDVTKGSFYWHFADRAALLTAVLEEWRREGTEAVIVATDSSAEDPVTRLRKLGETIFAATAHADLLEYEVRAWARADEQVAALVAEVDERRLAYVQDLLRAAGATPAVARHRASLLYRTLIGEFSWRRSGGEPLSRPALRELHRWLTADLGG